MNIYTAEEKQRMDTIVRNFDDYVRRHSYFDILYSEKVGYISLTVDPEADSQYMRLGSARDLLFFLFNEITNDVLLEKGEDFDGDFNLTVEKREASFCRIEYLVEKMPGEREYCLQQLDDFFELYPDVWDEWE